MPKHSISFKRYACSLVSLFPWDSTNPSSTHPCVAVQMLTFHPEYRITVEEALEHPYLEELHSQMDEPVSVFPSYIHGLHSSVFSPLPISSFILCPAFCISTCLHLLLTHMQVCDKHFDFDFEKHHSGHHTIPKPELQAMMYKVS